MQYAYTLSCTHRGMRNVCLVEHLYVEEKAGKYVWPIKQIQLSGIHRPPSLTSFSPSILYVFLCLRSLLLQYSESVIQFSLRIKRSLFNKVSFTFWNELRHVQGGDVLMPDGLSLFLRISKGYIWSQ